MKKLMNQKRMFKFIAFNGVLSTFLLLSSCDANDDSTEKNQTSNEGLRTGVFQGQEIKYTTTNGKNIFQGDMHITNEYFEENKQSRGVVRTELRWPNNTVYYKISNNVGPYLKKLINDAVNEFNTKTNIAWIATTDESQPFVEFYYSGNEDNTGWATIGYQNGYKYISLDGNATKGLALHEMGHTIGLFHEQSRTDRDKYITINWDNIQDDLMFNFSYYDYTFLGFNGEDIGEFDHNSIMMYPPYAFSKNGEPTIVLKNGEIYHYDTEKLTQSDINAINKIYPK